LKQKYYSWVEVEFKKLKNKKRKRKRKQIKRPESITWTLWDTIQNFKGIRSSRFVHPKKEKKKNDIPNLVMGYKP
jgi:hypothetical protein